MGIPGALLYFRSAFPCVLMCKARMGELDVDWDG